MSFQLANRSLKTRPFTAEEYGRMIAAGVLAEDERVELLEGDIIAMTPTGSHHAACVNRLNRLFSPLTASQKVVVSVQNPIHLSELSEPQPDLALVKPRPDDYAGSHPTPPEILLIIEVSDSSDDYDRSVKLPLYAKAGITEAWLVDLPKNRLEIYRSLSLEGYREMRWLAMEENISPLALPDFSVSIEDIFPPAPPF